MGLRLLEIFLILQWGDRHLSSESDVYRRQILTTKVDPRAVKVKPSRCIKASSYISENRLNFPTTRGFRIKNSMKLVYQYIAFFLIFHPLQIIFVHNKSRIATAIRGL